MMRIALCFAFFALGCNKLPPQPPEFRGVQVPSTATLAADGFYHVTGVIGFHDLDDAVATLSIRVPFVGRTYDLATPTNDGLGSMTIELKLASTSPKGPVEIDLTLIDDSGLASAPLTEMVTLE
jgi:hypothetical protein